MIKRLGYSYHMHNNGFMHVQNVSELNEFLRVGG